MEIPFSLQCDIHVCVAWLVFFFELVPFLFEDGGTTSILPSKFEQSEFTHNLGHIQSRFAKVVRRFLLLSSKHPLSFFMPVWRGRRKAMRNFLLLGILRFSAWNWIAISVPEEIRATLALAHR